MKKALMVLLTLVMVFCFAAVAQASPWKEKNTKKFFVKKSWRPVTVTDIGSHWAKQPVQVMASYGIILGYPDRTFRPDSLVTNFEAIMMISRAAGFEATAATPGESPDERFPAWIEDCINFAVDKGILEESELDGLKGNQPAKRYQVAVWAARAMGLEVDADGSLAFADADEIPFYARPYVGGMCLNRFIIGYPGNVFQPNKPVTRAELAMVLYRIMLAGDNGVNSDDDDDGDSAGLAVASLYPANGSNCVDPDTDELTVEFNEDICAVEDLDAVMDGIAVLDVTGGGDVDISGVDISGDTLAIRLKDPLENGKTYRVTVEYGVIEAADSGENFAGFSGADWQFATKSIYIEELTPENGEAGVDPAYVLKARFSGDISAVPGKGLLGAVRVYNVTSGAEVNIDKVEIDGDTLTITLEDELESDSTFEVTIKGGYLEDEISGVDFAGLAGNDWSFATS